MFTRYFALLPIKRQTTFKTKARAKKGTSLDSNSFSYAWKIGKSKL